MLRRLAVPWAALLTACSLATAPILPGGRDTGVPGLDAPGGLDVPGGLDAPSTETDAPIVGMDTPLTGTDAPVADPDVPPPPPDVPVVGTDAGTAGGIVCGATTCSAPQICCVSTDTDPATVSCVGPGGCRGLSVYCDGPEDCNGGEICCARGVGGPEAETICQAAIEPCTIRVCHSVADCGGGMCCPFMGSGYCAPFCL